MRSRSTPLAPTWSGSLTERLGERRGIRSGLTNTNGPQLSTATGSSEKADAIEPRLALGARRLAELAVETVGPGVVRALERLATTGALDHHVPAVAADVDEPAELAVAATDDRHRDWAATDAKKLPGSATWYAGPAYCQAVENTCSRSRSSTAGSEYHAAGSVQPSASACSSSGSPEMVALVMVLILTVRSVRIPSAPAMGQDADRDHLSIPDSSDRSRRRDP